MAFKIVFFLIVCAIVAGGLAVASRMYTPHGRLDLRAAILLRVIDLRKVDLFAEGRTAEEVREFAKKSGAPLKAHPPEVAYIEDDTIAGPAGPLSIRRFRQTEGNLSPALLFFHGGGWVMGDLDTHENICRTLARKTGAVVLSVGYRLAPEHPFPAALDDAYAALVWTAENAAPLGIDPEKIFIAGDSAGGNLAAAICLASRDRGGPAILGQALIYPATDLAHMDRSSYRYFATGYYLTRRYMTEFRNRYLPNAENRTEPLASPLLAQVLTGLPPALVITAGFDVLRDEGEAYAQRLRESGVPTTLSRYDGMIHGFLSMDRLFARQTKQATDEISVFVKSLIAPPGKIKKEIQAA